MMNVMIEQQEPSEFAVLAENWDTVRAFCAIQTQWRYGPHGGLLGLDYSAVAVALRALGIQIKTVFAGIQTMEHTMLTEAANEQR